jgi:lipid-A-disaccharide synthase
MPEENRNLKIFLCAGETSGDLHASNLIRAIRKARPGTEFAALGGNAMEAAGARLMHNMLGQFAVMGFIDAFKVLPAIKRLRDETLKELAEWRPDAAVLIDYPGFNLNLAFHLKRAGISVFYYICPQLWAWAPWRVKKMAARVDKALVVFPFEEEFYRRHKVPVEYVGHPLGDVFATRALDEGFVERGPVSRADYLVALLPGSRAKEIREGLPIKVKAAKLMKDARPEMTFAVPVTTEEHAEIAREIAAEGGLDAKVFVGKTYEVMRLARFALATSGTATLELAHFGVPMVVLYRTNPGGLLFSKTFLTTPYMALVNIVAGKGIVPEMLYWLDHSERIAELALDVIAHKEKYEAARRDVRAVGALIEAPGASAAAAKAILEGIGAPAADCERP